LAPKRARTETFALSDEVVDVGDAERAAADEFRDGCRVRMEVARRDDDV
jgi:hypothetical protein